MPGFKKPESIKFLFLNRLNITKYILWDKFLDNNKAKIENRVFKFSKSRKIQGKIKALTVISESSRTSGLGGISKKPLTCIQERSIANLSNLSNRAKSTQKITS